MNSPLQSAHLAPPSDNATFKVILLGVQTNVTPAEAKIKLSALFKVSAEQIDHLLARPGYVVKQAVTFEIASKYKSAIEGAGGACDIVGEDEPIIPLDVDLPDPISATAEPKQVAQICPSCAAELDVDSTFCTSCGHSLAEPAAQAAIQADANGTVPPPIDAAEPAAEKIWWLSHDGKQFGPYSESELKDKVVSNPALAKGKAWTEGMTAWQSVSSIPELNIAGSGPSQLPPPLQPQLEDQLLAAKAALGRGAASATSKWIAWREKVGRRNAYAMVGAGCAALFLALAFVPSTPGASDIKPFVVGDLESCGLWEISGVRKVDGIADGDKLYRVDFAAELTLNESLEATLERVNKGGAFKSMDCNSYYIAMINQRGGSLVIPGMDGMTLSKRYDVTGFGVLVKSEKGWQRIRGGIQGLTFTPK